MLTLRLPVLLMITTSFLLPFVVCQPGTGFNVLLTLAAPLLLPFLVS